MIRRLRARLWVWSDNHRDLSWFGALALLIVVLSTGMLLATNGSTPAEKPQLASAGGGGDDRDVAGAVDELPDLANGESKRARSAGSRSKTRQSDDDGDEPAKTRSAPVVGDEDKPVTQRRKSSPRRRASKPRRRSTPRKRTTEPVTDAPAPQTAPAPAPKTEAKTETKSAPPAREPKPEEKPKPPGHGHGDGRGDDNRGDGSGDDDDDGEDDDDDEEDDD